VAASGADRSFNFRQGGPSYEFNQQVLFGDINTMLTATPVTNPVGVSGTNRIRQKELNYQYTVGVQRELGWGTVLDLAYVGNTSRHRAVDWNFNQLQQGVRFLPSSRDTTTSSSPLADNFLRPFVGFGDMTVTGNGGTDRYDSLQMQVNRRFTGGFEIAGAYTYQNGLQTGQFQQLDIVRKDRLTDIQNHILSISYVIDVPGGSKLIPGRVSRFILDNWQISGVNTFSTGKPDEVELATTDAFDFTGGGESCGAHNGGGSGGVVQTGPAILPRGERGFDQWFDTSVFQRPSGRGDIGNMCNNYTFRLPGINNWDISFFKNFPVGENKKFQFRMEMYNVLNHTQFENVNVVARFNPAGAQTNNQFGRVTSARQERRMQLALRFNF
jgi:hypothetical protein